MGGELAEANFMYYPFDRASTPRSGLFEIHVNEWWAVHPRRGLAFFRRKSGVFPQCNIYRSCVEDLVGLTAQFHDVRQISVVYIPISAHSGAPLRGCLVAGDAELVALAEGVES